MDSAAQLRCWPESEACRPGGSLRRPVSSDRWLASSGSTAAALVTLRPNPHRWMLQLCLTQRLLQISWARSPALRLWLPLRSQSLRRLTLPSSNSRSNNSRSSSCSSQLLHRRQHSRYSQKVHKHPEQMRPVLRRQRQLAAGHPKLTHLLRQSQRQRQSMQQQQQHLRWQRPPTRLQPQRCLGIR